jgi:hypothetical protein
MRPVDRASGIVVERRQIRAVRLHPMFGGCMRRTLHHLRASANPRACGAHYQS